MRDQGVLNLNFQKKYLILLHKILVDEHNGY